MARLDAVIADEADSDRQSRRAFGTALLAGGAIAAGTAVIPFVLPGVGAPLNIVYSSVSLGVGVVYASMGVAMLLQRSPWEHMAAELADDPVMEPEARLHAAILRWEQRVERERSGQRFAAGSLIVVGGLSVLAGASAMFVSPSAPSFGTNAVMGLPLILLGAAYVPLGIAMFGQRTPSERALRVFRLSQGERLARYERGGLRLTDVGATLSGLAVSGTF